MFGGGVHNMVVVYVKLLAFILTHLRLTVSESSLTPLTNSLRHKGN